MQNILIRQGGQWVVIESYTLNTAWRNATHNAGIRAANPQPGADPDHHVRAAEAVTAAFEAAVDGMAIGFVLSPEMESEILGSSEDPSPSEE